MTATILIGIVVALLYAEIIGILPGGIIVPALMALYLDQPLRVVATILAAFLSFGCYKFFGRYFLLFGRRRFVLLLLLGALFGQLWLLLWPRLFAAPLDLRVIGWIIPGLLANNLVRQKILPTLASLATVTILTYF
ncbi:MAG: poly-gamma-glutamate biosynthesis protein PgsC, partial [Candidatus Aminicenantes bacterium]|nr:poly-gamma-glutamate biosynthesis protein PgsC [Candidatus Aminicenantes bacterium]